MKTQFISNDEAQTIDQAYTIAPWACEIIQVEGGYKAFESATDAEIWKNQT